MQESSSKFNPSDSLLSEGLPDYSRGYLPTVNLSASSGQFSFNSIQKKINLFKDSVFEKSYDELEQIKKDFHKERNSLIQRFNLQKYNREVIKSFINNEELQLQFKEDKKKKQQLQEQNQLKKQQLQRMKAQNEEKIRQKQAYEQFVQFKSKLKQKFNKQKQSFQNKDQINGQIIKILNQNLKIRSQQTLNKLKPYLEYSIKECKQNNKILQGNNEFIKGQNQKFDAQVRLSIIKALQENERKKKYEHEDQIEDQLILSEQIKQYKQQFKKDVQILRKKVFVQ